MNTKSHHLKQTPARIPRIIYNDDSCTLRFTPPPHTVESLAIALDYLKGTQVDCLCWCMGGQTAFAERSFPAPYRELKMTDSRETT